MSDVLNKYRVEVVNDSGLWLNLTTYHDEYIEEYKGWYTVHIGGSVDAKWRLTGGYIMPAMWFKPFEERIKIAVSYAVDVVKDELAKENKQTNADVLAEEWTAKAMAMFADALKEVK
jgi:hypothetical protein